MAVAACGTPEYTYVKNTDAGLYLKVPRSWSSFDSAAVNARVTAGAPAPVDGQPRPNQPWHAAFDAARTPSVDHVFGTNPEAPVVWTFVRDVAPQERGRISLNAMRDLVMPVSEAASQAEASGKTGEFQVQADEELNPQKGIYGLRTVFSHLESGVMQTVDQTVLTNDKHTKLYYLVVRCSAQCFKDRKDQISTIVESFTVRD